MRHEPSNLGFKTRNPPKFQRLLIVSIIKIAINQRYIPHFQASLQQLGLPYHSYLSSVQNPCWLMILIMWGYTTQYIGVTLSQFIVGNPIKQRVHRGTEGFEHRVICILKLNTEMSWLYLRYIEYKPCFATFDKWLGHTENSLQTISSLSRSDALFVALHDSE